ncbi:MAG: pyridoxal phosphate-dependent aminotransferase family protein [Bdellovibrionales bacterium]|nr:pyridoxal phosphate-dependent aminotransferase family protein [Bdellovibrionales bacterium]
MIKEIKIELKSLAELGRLQEFSPAASRLAGKINFRGQDLTNFTNWDFFNLNGASKVKRAAQSEIEVNGPGSNSSRLVTGTSLAHISCEGRIARFLGTESAVLFSSVNQAVLSLVAAVVSDKDCVVVDDQLQSPAIDVSYLVNADVINFETSNPDSLAKVLEQTKQYQERFLFVESISPLSGKRADLGVLSKIATEHGTHLIVDESYALGIEGLRGAGGCERFKVGSKALVQYGSLAFGLGGYGAFVAGSKEIITYLINRSKTFSAEVALPSSIAAQVEAGINIVELQTGARERFSTLSRSFRTRLKEIGFDVETGLDTPIVCLTVANRKVAEDLQEILFKKGYCVEVLSSPFVREEAAAVRFLLNVSHTPEIIDGVIKDLAEVYSKLI